MNITIIVMLLASIGFLGIGAFILNNKYIKNNSLEDDYAVKEVKAMQLSGKINISIGIIGIIISILCILNSQWIKPLLIILAISILILSMTQYMMSKKIRA